MHLEKLEEQASGYFAGPADDAQRMVQPVSGLMLLAQDGESPIEAYMYEPVLCLILQGAKSVSIGDETHSFARGECLLVSHDLPVRSMITKAPYLALVFQVNLAIVRDLCVEISTASFDNKDARSALTHEADPGLVDALARYLQLADSPADAQVLGPLVSKEIHYRLLSAPFGGMLRNLTRETSSASAIARAIGEIKGNIRSQLAVPDLAKQVGMSVSSFHKHFKTITSTTPLQYQKELRLLQARQLIRSGQTTVTSAAYDVGYESPSQFSREYVRKFGVAPSRDNPRL